MDSPKIVFFEQLFLLERGQEYLEDELPKLACLAISDDVVLQLHGVATLAGRHRSAIVQIFVKHRIELSYGDCKAVKGFLRGSRSDLPVSADANTKEFLLLAVFQRLLNQMASMHESLADLAEELGFDDGAATLRRVASEMVEREASLRLIGRVSLRRIEIG